jgi:hypothetical protein
MVIIVSYRVSKIHCNTSHIFIHYSSTHICLPWVECRPASGEQDNESEEDLKVNTRSYRMDFEQQNNPLRACIHSKLDNIQVSRSNSVPNIHLATRGGEDKDY